MSILESICTANGNASWRWALETALVLCLHQLLVAHLRGLGYVNLGSVWHLAALEHDNKQANEGSQMAGLFERGAKQLGSLYKNVRYTQKTQKIPINKRLPREIWIREYKHQKQTRPSPSLCLLVSTLLIASAANTEKVTFLQHKKPLRGR